MQAKEDLGSIIANAIMVIMQEKRISEEELLTRLGRKPNLFSRFMYDVRKGNLTLQSVVNIANALEVNALDLMNIKYEKERWDLETLISKGKINYRAGDVVDLPKLLSFMWESLNNSDRKKIGKEVYNEIMQGKYASHIKFHHKTSSNHAFYEIV